MIVRDRIRSRVRPRRAQGALGLAALSAAVLAAACSVSGGDASKGAAAGGGTRTADAAPAPSGWRPSEAASVAGVPAAEVRTAVGRQLAGRAPAGVAADQWRHVQRLYKQFGGAPLWMGEQGPDKARTTALLKALVSADGDGLDLSRYPLPALAAAMTAVQTPAGGARATAQQIAEADVLLSSAYAALSKNLLAGQTNPKEVSKEWFINPGEERVDSALVRSLGDPDVGRGIDRMRPQDADYQALRTALVQYRELAAKGDWPRVPAGRALMPGEGDSPARLTALRNRLAAEGLLGGAGGDSVRAAAADTARGRAQAATPPVTDVAGPGDAATAAGAKAKRRVPPRAGQAAYDAALAGGVAAFQARHGIAVDSVLGAETVNAMNVPVAYRLGQIATNLERHRWLPRALGSRYVVVNVPAFKLEAWDGGRKALEMKVVVGKDYEDRKTPVFADSMETVVFRPYWNITDDIAAKETWPKIRANPDYMRANNLETFQEGGRTHIRQLPGDSNSLGLVKFLFPNQYNIYLHDTPEKQLFSKDVRGFSHGCIRVEKPVELAGWVLGEPAEQVRQQMQTPPDNKSVKLPRKIPVYIAYFTAYAQGGQLYFGNDLYGRDGQTVQAMDGKFGQSGETVQAVETLRKLVSA